MKSLLLIFLLGAVLSAQATPASDLKALWARVYADASKQITLNVNTLQSDQLAQWTQWISNGAELKFSATNVATFYDDANVAEIDVDVSNLKLWGAVVGFKFALWKVKDAKDFGAALTLSVQKGNWTFARALPTTMMPADSWLNVLNFNQAAGTIAAATDDRTLKTGRTVQRGLVLDLDGAVSTDGALFGLSRLIGTDLKSLSLKAHVEVPFQPTAQSQIQTAAVTLNIQTALQLPLSASSNIVASSFALRVAGIGSQKTTLTMSISASVSMQFAQDSALTFAVSGDWTASTQTLNLAGSMSGSWVHPFGLNWLTINQASVQASLAVGQKPPLRTLSLGGAAQLVFGKWQVNAQIAASSTSADFTQLGLQLTLKATQDSQLLSILQSMAGDSSLAPAAIKDLHLHDGSLTIAVYSFDAQFKKGVTVQSSVHVVGSTTTASLMQPLTNGVDFTFTLNLYLPVFSDMKQTDIKLGLQIASLPLASNMQLQNTNLQFDLSATPSVSLAAQLAVTFANTPPPAIFTVSASWSKASQELDLTGGFTSWVNPFGIKGLTFNNALVTAKISLGHALLDFQFTCSASIALTHSSQVVTATVTTAFPKGDFSQISAVLSLTLASTTSSAPLQTLIQTLTGDDKISSPALSGMKLGSGAVTIAIVTYDNAPQYKKGLTVSTDVHLTGTQAQKLVGFFGSGVSAITFSTDVFIPIFAQPVWKNSDIVITLRASNIVVNTHMRFTDVSLTLDISSSPSLSISCGMGVQIRDWSELLFSVSAGWQMSSETVALVGALTSPWVHPFGLKMITINSAMINARFSMHASAVVKSLALSMTGSATFTLKAKTSSGTPYDLTSTFSLTMANDFKDVGFVFSLALRSHGDLIRTALGLSGTAPLAIDDLKSLSASTSLYISTYDYTDSVSGKTIKKGLQVSGEVDFVVGTPLAQRLAKLFKPSQAELQQALAVSALPEEQQALLTKFKQYHPPTPVKPLFDSALTSNTDNTPLVYVSESPLLMSVSTTPSNVHLDVFLPIFSSSVIDGCTATLGVENIPIKSNLVLSELGVELGLSASIAGISLKVIAALAVKFKNQPDWITFAVDGGIDTSATVTIEGAMIGTLDHLFGLKGVSVSNLWVEVGFVPAVSLDKLGFGGNLTLGNTVMALNAFVDLTHCDDIAFQAIIEHLSLKELARTWNKMHSRSQIDVDRVPDLFDLQDVEIDLAGETTVINIGDKGVVTFEKGLTIICDATLLGIDKVHVHIHTDFSLSEPDFVFEIHFAFATLYDSFIKYMNSIFQNKELQPPDLAQKTEEEIAKFIYDLSFIIPQLKSLTVDLFSFSQIAAGATPEFAFTVTVFGKDHSLDLKLNLENMVHTLAQLFQTAVINLKQLLGLPQCVINLDCPSGKVCSHSSDGWTCVSGCASSSGQLPLFGCVKCLTSAECTHQSAYGPCCDNGQCSPAGDGEMCGMCWFGHTCNSPESGCTLGFCHRCLTSLDCLWSGVEGHHCVNSRCVATSLDGDSP